MASSWTGVRKSPSAIPQPVGIAFLLSDKFTENMGDASVARFVILLNINDYNLLYVLSILLIY